MRTVFFLLIALCSVAGAEPLFQDRFEVDMSNDLLALAHDSLSNSDGFSIYTADLNHKGNIKSISGNGQTVAANPNYTMMAVGNHKPPYLDIYDMTSWSIMSGISFGSIGVVRDVEFSHDGAWIALASTSHQVKVFNTSDWSLVAEVGASSTGTDDNSYAVAFSNDDSMLAVAVKEDNTTLGSTRVDVYRTSDWSLITKPFGSELMGSGIGLHFNPTDSLLAVSRNGPFESEPLLVFNTNDWSVAHTHNGDSANYPTDVQFSNDGSLLAFSTGGGTDPFLVFNTSDWSQVSGIPSPGSPALCVAFNDDDSRLAVGLVADPRFSVYNTSDWSEESGDAPPPSLSVRGMTFADGIVPLANLLIGAFP